MTAKNPEKFVSSFFISALCLFLRAKRSRFRCFFTVKIRIKRNILITKVLHKKNSYKLILIDIVR